MIRTIPPVFNEVCLTSWGMEDASQYWEEHYPSYRPTFFRSGTEALACALNCVLDRMEAADRNVVIPAYGCPDLVAAAIFADANPVLVDVLPDRWGYNLVELEKSLEASPAVVVAVDLLGLGDQYAELSEIAGRYNCPIVQDAAQCISPDESGCYQAPYVVWSFGRGKPVNFLGGGALLSRHETDLDLTHVSTVKRHRWRTWLGWKEAWLFNHVVRSPLFGLLSRIPGTGVGSTVYSSCDEIVKLPDKFLSHLAPALARKFGQQSDVEAQLAGLVSRLAGRDRCNRLSHRNGIELTNLLRLSLLANSEAARDSLISALNKRGLGASTMYGVTLPDVEGMPAIVSKQQGFSGADVFAGRLLTLPVHNLVTNDHLEVIGDIFSRSAS